MEGGGDEGAPPPAVDPEGDLGVSDDAAGPPDDDAELDPANAGRPPAAARPGLLHSADLDAAPSSPAATTIGPEAGEGEADRPGLVGPSLIAWLAGVATAVVAWAIAGAVLLAATGVGMALAFTPAGPCLIYCGLMGACTVGTAAPAGQGVATAAGWKAIRGDRVSVIAPILTAYVSCVTLSAVGVVVTAAMLGIEGLRRRDPAGRVVLVSGSSLNGERGVVAFTAAPPS